MKKILIVEDDKLICEELVQLLTHEGYESIVLEDFEHALNQMSDANADLILLDINIPGLNGEFLLKQFRKEYDTPVIMVTSRTSEVDEVLSMSYGADDYITKPYNPTLLLLRIAAILRRTERSSHTVMYRDIKVNPARGILEAKNVELTLTKNEMIIFQHLLEHQGTIVSRDELMTNLWDNDEFINDNALTVNMSRLRTKLAEFGYPNAIETRKKQGYILV